MSVNRIYDLIYDNAFREKFKKKYPDAEIKDAEDLVHPSRFAISLPENVTEKEYFEFLILENATRASLLFALNAMGKKR